MRVILDRFGGLVPRLSPHKLKPQQASLAHNVKLRNGRLVPWRERCPYASVGQGNLSFHLSGCCTVAWPTVVQAADVAPDWGRFYITGRTTALEAVEMSCDCKPTYYFVGVPAPLTPPTAIGDEESSRKADARSYVYTYVNKWYEESAPSPASNLIQVADDSTVTVTGIAIPPEGYGIIAANIYRTATGTQVADGKIQKPLTDYLYVGTVTFPSTTFTDNILGKFLGQPLSTQKVRMPPAHMQNICKIDGVARLAGTTKNHIHVSENFQYHNWPVVYDLTLPHTIIHMVAVDQKLYVTTDSVPYVVDVSSCEEMKCTPVYDVQSQLPDIACKYNHAVIGTPFGMFFSSPIGLVLIDSKASWTIATARWFSADDWQKIQPDTVRLAYWQGFLFIVTDTVTLLLDINGDPYGDIKDAELSTLSDHPVDLEVTPTGKLMMLEGEEVSVWDSAETFREFLWESRELTPGNGSDAYPRSFTWSPVSGKILSKDTKMTLFNPRGETVYERKVINERPFRIPRAGRHLWYRLRLEGIDPVEFAELGTAHFTVNDGA